MMVLLQVVRLGMSVGRISRPASATPGNLNPKTQVQKEAVKKPPEFHSCKTKNVP
jgi:hypothetical protein